MAITITSSGQLKTTEHFEETDTKNITFSSNYTVYCNELKEDSSFYFEVDSSTGNYIIHCTELIEE